MPSPTKLLVVIPAFNEALRIRGVVEAVRGQVAADVLVVDDGSRDLTGAEARAGGAIVATHPVNLGYGSALQTGYRYALRHAYDAVLQLDADGQHDPASIPPLLVRRSPTTTWWSAPASSTPARTGHRCRAGSA